MTPGSTGEGFDRRDEPGVPLREVRAAGAEHRRPPPCDVVREPPHRVRQTHAEGATGPPARAAELPAVHSVALHMAGAVRDPPDGGPRPPECVHDGPRDLDRRPPPPRPHGEGPPPPPRR